MKLQVVISQANGNTQVSLVDKPSAGPAQVKVLPNSKIEVIADGVRLTGRESLGKSRLSLKQQGADMLVETEQGEALVALQGYYREEGCRRAFKFDHLCALNFDQA